MAVKEVKLQNRFFRITCDGDCGRSVHVTAPDETAALDRVRELRFWQADEQGQRCPTCSDAERRAA